MEMEKKAKLQNRRLAVAYKATFNIFFPVAWSNCYSGIRKRCSQICINLSFDNYILKFR
jgi:hypothetical protein